MNPTQHEAPAMDMRQFEGAFFEEAAEHLADLERLLVRMDIVTPTAEELDAIFRAAHSLKGGSSMFGFQDMTTLTHDLESLLDKVRKHELPLRAEMVDLLLESSDVLRAQLAHYSRQPGAAQVSIDGMCARIRVCAGTGGTAGIPLKTISALPIAPTVTASAPSTRTLEIAFPVNPDAAALIPDLLGQLAELGTLEEPAHAPLTASTPARKGGKKAKRITAPVPARVVHLTTDATDDVVLMLFEFIMDSATVKITPVASHPVAGQARDTPSPAKAQTTSSQDPGYGFFATPDDAAAASAMQSDAPAAVHTVAASDPQSPRTSERAAVVDSSIRVSVEKVDQLINLVGELVITQAMLMQSAAKVDPIAHEKLVAGMADLERNTRDLQESVMSIRMMPIAFVFNRLPRLVRDLAAKLGKQVQLQTVGEGTELDKGLIEKISDPLTHLVRNSIDHGIEAPEARIAAGKSALGTITLRATHQGGNIIVEVADDGAGLNRERIFAKARERGLPVSDATPDAELWNLIFDAGFSTATVVTDVSGRGVGMDVVRRNISALGGSVEIDSALGIGTRITVRLPLTLAIMDGMSVAVGSEVYILPLSSIVESLQVDEGQVRSVAGQGLVIDVRGEFLPVVSLHELFVNGPALGLRASGTMVIVEAEGGKTALLVDELLGQHQVVVKSLDANYRKVHGISGATIMGDGRVALILDVSTLTRNRRQTTRAHTATNS